MCAKVPEINQYFKIVDKLGEGTFSKVYKAVLRRPYRSSNHNANSELSGSSDSSTSHHQVSSNSSSDEAFALKYIIPIVKPGRIAKELRFLRDLQGLSNVIPIRACFFHGGHAVIVMPIIDHDKFLDYFQMMDIIELREYLRNLLIALERVHSLGKKEFYC